MVKKTRDKFIEVARQLFARKGIENTTMHDIASASDKGRRTIYTYFKSKREIYNAVVESETEQLLGRLAEIVNRNISPESKIEQYFACRFETMREIVKRNGSLRASFFRDFRRVDRARRAISKREIQLLADIMMQGKMQGVFHVDDCRQTAVIITHSLHGLDAPYFRDTLVEEGIDKSKLKDYISNLILYGIKRRD